MKYRVIAALLLSALCLSACGKNMTREVPGAAGAQEAAASDASEDAAGNTADSSEDTSDSSEDTAVSSADNEDKEKEEAPEAATPESASDAIKELYIGFLKGESTATLTDNYSASLKKGEEYSYEDIVDALYLDDISEYADDLMLSNASYSYIDCGNDGTPELAVRLSYGNYDELHNYLIFRYDGEKIIFVTSEAAYYRKEVYLNSCGYLYAGGSNGAASYGYNYYLINGEGERIFLYNINTHLGLSEAYIAYFDIVEADRPAKYPKEVGFAEDDGVCTEAVTFMEYVPDEAKGGEEYVRSKFFSFYDNRTGEYVAPSEKFASIYDEIGIKYYTPKECTDIVLKHVEELGATDEIREASDPEWENLKELGVGTYFYSLESVQRNIDLMEGNWICKSQSPDVEKMYLAIGRDGSFKLDVNYTDTYKAPGYVNGHIIFRKSSEWGSYDMIDFYVEDTNISKVKFDRYLGMFEVDYYKVRNDTAEVRFNMTVPAETIFLEYYGNNQPVFEKAFAPTPESASDYVYFYEPANDRFFYSEDTCTEAEDIEVTQVSEAENEIIDYDVWFAKAGIDKPEQKYQDDKYIYELVGIENYSTSTMLKISDKATGNLLHTYDFHDFMYSKGYEYNEYVDRGIHYALIKDDILYVNLYHSTYASSCPNNAYMMAIDMNSQSILWRSDALISNSNNFVIYKDRIITGYGFTGEKDYLSVLDIHTGKVQSKINVRKSPDYFALKGNRLYVRTYSYDYEFEVK